MKTFKTVLQNAIEDYLTNLDKDITLTDIEEICKTDISSVVWKAYSQAEATRKYAKAEPLRIVKEPVINGIRQSYAKQYLLKSANSLLGKPVGKVINAISYLFKTSDTYGFKFSYGTRKGLHECLEHNQDDTEQVIAISLIKK